MKRCIYCLKSEKDDAAFKKTEHVMPQSFGVFENNLTLNGAVCDACNQYFGDHLELDLARGSLEGGMRFDRGVKKPEEYKTAGKKDRVVIKVGEGPLKGAYAYRTYSEADKAVVIIPAPQVGFLNPTTGKYDYYLVDNIPDKDEIEKKGYDTKDPKGIFMPLKYEQVVKRALEEKGIIYEMNEEIDHSMKKGEQWECDIKGTIDDTIMRAIAKIAFNYLTYWQGVDFVLDKRFDIIRNFILKNDKPDYPLVQIIDDAILGDEPSVGKRRSGHLITINWVRNGAPIIAQVSLFNWMTYCVCLAGEYSGESRDLQKGNFFNIHSKEISELGKRNRSEKKG